MVIVEPMAVVNPQWASPTISYANFYDNNPFNDYATLVDEEWDEVDFRSYEMVETVVPPAYPVEHVDVFQPPPLENRYVEFVAQEPVARPWVEYVQQAPLEMNYIEYIPQDPIA